MRRRLPTYTAFSTGCFIVWAVLFAIGAARHTNADHHVLLVFGGWVIGWLSATIPRYVYPPPKRYRQSST